MMAVIDSDIITQLTIADQAIAGNLVDVTGGADSYIVRGLTADWMKNLVPCSSIGAHDFYQTK
jgi:hypothetical protein